MILLASYHCSFIFKMINGASIIIVMTSAAKTVAMWEIFFNQFIYLFWLKEMQQIKDLY